MAEVVITTLKISVVALIFAMGLSSRPSHVVHLFERPGLLVRSLLAMYVVVPLAALAIVFLLPLGTLTKAAILILAASAGAPLLPKKLAKIGNEDYVLSLVVLSSVLAIIAVPVWIAIYANVFGVELELTFAEVAAILGKGFLIPIGAGMGLRLLIPAHAEKTSQWLLVASAIGLGLAGLALLGSQIRHLGDVSISGYAGLLLMLVISLGVGHWLGGPDPRNRSALAVTCATRHLGIVILLATSIPGARVGVLVVVYLLASLLVTIPYMQWRQRSLAGSAVGADATS